MLAVALSIALTSSVQAQADELAAPPPVGAASQGTRVPPGHHLEERRSTGFFVTGSIMFGGSYLASVATGLVSLSEQPGAWSLFIPVVGPLMFVGLYESEPDPCGGPFLCVDPGPLMPILSVVLGLVQGVGAVFFAIGLPTREVLVRDDTGRVALDVGVDIASDGASATMNGAF
jgi:hypothetical protein